MMAKKKQNSKQARPKQIKLSPEEIQQALAKISTCDLDDDRKCIYIMFLVKINMLHPLLNKDL